MLLVTMLPIDRRFMRDESSTDRPSRSLWRREHYPPLSRSERRGEDNGGPLLRSETLSHVRDCVVARAGRTPRIALEEGEPTGVAKYAGPLRRQVPRNIKLNAGVSPTSLLLQEIDRKSTRLNSSH